jgi:hypothetical protein
VTSSQDTGTSTSSGWNEAGATCAACGIGVTLPMFTSLAEQREHFKTDWHRLNVKLRVQKKPQVTEEEFERLIAEDDGVSPPATAAGCGQHQLCMLVDLPCVAQ